MSPRDHLPRSLRRRLRRRDDDRYLADVYRFILDREIDAGARERFLELLESGATTREEVRRDLVESPEFFFGYEGTVHLLVLHESRRAWVASLPSARRILDLGGSAASNPAGALVELGYRHRFDQLVVLDLYLEQWAEEEGGAEEAAARRDHHDSVLGRVEYRYQSFTDLSGFADREFDLVVMGQTIEHIAEADADALLPQVRRVLVPGGRFCLDTPNAPVCRMVNPGLLHPDHELEYSHEQLSDKLVAAGFVIERAEGLAGVPESAATGRFSMPELLAHPGIYPDPEAGFLLAYVCRRPDVP